jgi:hypothetical protein
MGMLIGIWLIGAGIYGVWNKKGNSLAYSILSVGQIILGIWSLVLLIIIIWVREFGSNLFGLLPR